MKSLILALALVAIPAAASASCVGTEAFQSCYDGSGNSYTVQRFGNSTYMNGHNANTGSNWSQNSTTIGNSTFTTGRAANGNSWNMQQQRVGGMTFYNGTDSNGNSFSGSCNQFGCN